MPRLSPADRLRFRRVFVVSLLALLLEIALGVVVWRAEQWHLLVLAGAFTTLLIATTMGLLLAGDRWKLVGDFGQGHPLIMVSLIMGTVAAWWRPSRLGPSSSLSVLSRWVLSSSWTGRCIRSAIFSAARSRPDGSSQKGTPAWRERLYKAVALRDRGIRKGPSQRPSIELQPRRQ